jgi:hypothetical protein
MTSLRPILAVLPLRQRIRADFGLVHASGGNPKQRPSRSPDTNPEYPRAALCCLVKNNSPMQHLLCILVASQNGSPCQATQRASAHRSSQDIGASLPERKDEEVYAERNDIKLPILIETF